MLAYPMIQLALRYWLLPVQVSRCHTLRVINKESQFFDGHS